MPGNYYVYFMPFDPNSSTAGRTQILPELPYSSHQRSFRSLQLRASGSASSTTVKAALHHASNLQKPHAMTCICVPLQKLSALGDWVHEGDSQDGSWQSSCGRIEIVLVLLILQKEHSAGTLSC